MALTGVPGSAKMSLPSWNPIRRHLPSTKRLRGACQSSLKLMTEYHSERATGKTLALGSGSTYPPEGATSARADPSPARVRARAASDRTRREYEGIVSVSYTH